MDLCVPAFLHWFAKISFNKEQLFYFPLLFTCRTWILFYLKGLDFLNHFEILKSCYKTSYLDWDWDREKGIEETPLCEFDRTMCVTSTTLHRIYCLRTSLSQKSEWLPVSSIKLFLFDFVKVKIESGKKINCSKAIRLKIIFNKSNI